MTTYLIRDALKEKIARALETLTDAQINLRLPLDTQLGQLQQEDWTVTDRTFETIGMDELWKNFPTLETILKNNPARMALNEDVLLTPVQITAIETASMPHGSLPPVDYLNKIVLALDNDPHLLNELLFVMHQLWTVEQENKSYPYDDVAVLLPVRLETLFDSPNSEMNEDPDRWKLSLRVIPDEASICRHNRFISTDEKKALITFWQSIIQDGDVNQSWLESEVAPIAWNILCTKIRSERAAWLVPEIEIKITNGSVDIISPDDLPSATEPNRVAGLPKEIHIHVVTEAPIEEEDHFLIGRLPMDSKTYINNNDLILPLTSDLKNQKNEWWASWVKAKEVGLGGEYMLPVGINPETITTLYVTGAGDEAPDELFTEQALSGELSVARLGTPTNSIHGKPTGELTNWLKVATTRLQRRLNPYVGLANTGSKIQKQLTGNENALPFFPGSDAPDDTEKSKQLVSALWPALWGNWMHSQWNMGDHTFRRGSWAMEHLCPEGPLMPLRISDQPYGLLPVTSLELFEYPVAIDPDSAAQQEEEQTMAKLMYELQKFWTERARNKGSIVNKSSEQFMETLGIDANSDAYSYLNFLSFLIPMSMHGLDEGKQEEFTKRVLELYQPAMSLLNRQPNEITVANGNFNNSALPLIQSTNTLFRSDGNRNRSPLSLSSFIEILIHYFDSGLTLEEYDLNVVFKRYHIMEGPAEYLLGSLPDSLLIRLLVYACQISTVWLQQDPHNPILQKALEMHQKQLHGITEDLDKDGVIDKYVDDISGMLLFKAILPEALKQQWERALCATLDSAANRIDPWVTGFAWQRLKQHSQSERHHHRLGIYGWLDGPFIGKPGPTNSGLLHTPSYNQTLAALIMRDKFLSSERKSLVNESGQNPWHMDINSQKVRLAEEIADEVRMGFHIYEILGRHIENIIGEPLKIRTLRSDPKYAMRVERKDVKEVCDGQKTLPLLINGDVQFPLNTNQTNALLLLRDALDTYSDLLTSDGILQVVTRQTGKASETMDAAAGFSRPPSFEFIQTPPSGYHLETMVVSALPFISIETLNGSTNPIRLADPSVAQFIEKQMGKDWTWTAINEDDQSIIGSVSLSSLQLTSLDTLSMSEEVMKDLVNYKLRLTQVFISVAGNRIWEVFNNKNKRLGRITLSELNLDPKVLPELDELNALICSNLGLPATSLVKEGVPKDLRLWVVRDEHQNFLGLADKKSLKKIPKNEEKLNKSIRQLLHIPNVKIIAPRSYQLTQQLMASLGQRPASVRDFTESTVPGIIDTSIYSELATRYGNLYKVGQQFIIKINAANTDESRAIVLREALSWGIIPATDPSDREGLMAALTEAQPSKSATPLDVLVKNISDLLKQRLDGAVNPDDLIKENDLATPIKDPKALKKLNIPDGVPSLAKAIANLASPAANLIILACWDKNAFIQNTKLITNHEEDIEEDWLTVVATVRASLARLEALQMELTSPLLSYTNSPGDPWRTADVMKNIQTRKSDSVSKLEMNRFVAAYGSNDSWQSDKIAAGLIDSFSEAIPMPERKTSVAFGFNAPAARAPQAILLAVPPKTRTRLDETLILKILEETRALAQGRTNQMEDLGEMQSLIPTMWFQGSGVPRIWLDNKPLFEN